MHLLIIILLCKCILALRLGSKRAIEWYSRDLNALLPLEVAQITEDNIEEHLRFIRNLRGLNLLENGSASLQRDACERMRRSRFIELVNIFHECCQRRPWLANQIARHVLTWDCVSLVLLGREEFPPEVIDRLIPMLGIFQGAARHFLQNRRLEELLRTRLPDCRHHLPATWSQLAVSREMPKVIGGWEMTTFEWDYETDEESLWLEKLDNDHPQRFEPFNSWLSPYFGSKLEKPSDWLGLAIRLSRIVCLASAYTACRAAYPPWRFPKVWWITGRRLVKQYKLLLKAKNLGAELHMLCWVLALMRQVMQLLREGGEFDSDSDCDWDDPRNFRLETWPLASNMPTAWLALPLGKSTTRQARYLSSLLGAQLWMQSHPEMVSNPELESQVLELILDLTDPLGNPAISYHDSVLLALALHHRHGDGWNRYLVWIRQHREYEQALAHLPESPIRNLDDFSLSSRAAPMIRFLDSTGVSLWLAEKLDHSDDEEEDDDQRYQLELVEKPICSWQVQREKAAAALQAFLSENCRLDWDGHWEPKRLALDREEREELWDLIMLHWHLRLPFQAQLSWRLVRSLDDTIAAFDPQANLVRQERRNLILGHYFIKNLC